MPEQWRDEAANNALGEFIVELFRLNGLLLAEGDRLTQDLGLSSARWQVIGALELAGRPLPVAQIARNMGLARQSVQRITNELEAEGIVAFDDNPDHLRAKLVVLTPKGHQAYRAAMKRQSVWSNDVLAASGVNQTRLRDAKDVLRRLHISITEMKE
jgi:DNA-binding MarR family transcriptional regulator